jgi:hypothetical protein
MLVYNLEPDSRVHNTVGNHLIEKIFLDGSPEKSYLATSHAY